MAGERASGARTRARELLLQALYQQQIAGHDCDELLVQFREQKAYERVDAEFFEESLKAILDGRKDLETKIATIADRPLDQLDPVEHGILLIGVFELERRIDIPYRVVLNEGVHLARRFGAVDSHKYVNACLDRAAQALRESEFGG